MDGDKAMKESGSRWNRRVSVTYEPTPWSESCLRLGLIALDTDHASESELRRMLPAGQADLFTTRVRYGGQCDVNNLRSMGEGLEGATELLLPGSALHAIAYGCTSGTVAIGIDRVRESIQSVRPGIPVTTPITAARNAFARLGMRRIAMLTPYTEEVNELVAEHLGSEGVEVADLASFGLNTDIEMTSVPPEAIEAGALELSRAVDGVFICCTALRSVGTIEPLERRLGCPVVTSNQAMTWEMLRMAGYRDPVAGFGELLRLPAD